LMGDNIYSNSTEPPKQRSMYLAFRADPHFSAFGAATPIYAIWDDHDFGKDNSDRTEPGKDRSLQTFNELWPNPPAAARAGDGIWSRFTVGQSEFFLLDVRYHRSPDVDPDGASKTMLGGEQLEWFERSLADSAAVFKFPVSGSSWNCGGVEAWNHQYLHEYDSILANVRDRQVNGIVLLGGDQHQCTIAVRPAESWDGYDLHEWMAGRLWAGDRENQIKGFGLITVDTTADPPTTRLEFFDQQGRPRRGKRLPYTTPGALRALWDSPPGSMGTPLRSADGELRHTTSGAVWDAMPLVTGETLTLDDLEFAVEPPARTTLSDPSIRYSVSASPYAVLCRGAIEAMVVDNSAVDNSALPGHRAGYSGVASLKHDQQPENLFVPTYAGLNFEHIHDGRGLDRKILFEPRNAPMELRRIDENTVELHQPPTPNWRLDSTTRYHLMKDGTIEMTFECVPRRRSFQNNFIGLFWASYIHQPESLDIHFLGKPGGAAGQPDWIRGITPEHGVRATHRVPGDIRDFAHDDEFARTLKLVFGFSDHRYAEPWYYGVSHGMAFLQVFRPSDEIRLTQSPSGGGRGNPAWDFQYFIPDYEVGRRYQIVMRAIYVPYESPEQMRRLARKHLAELMRK